MDYQEAIEALELKEITIEGNARRVAKFFEGLDIAISAMQELQMYKDNRLCLIPDDVYKRQCEELDKYKEIGTVKGCEDAIKAYDDCYFEKQELEQELYKYKQLGEFAEVKSAVEKQKPRKPKKDYIYCYPEKWCENCNNVVFVNWEYCPKCGQKILWKETNEYDS